MSSVDLTKPGLVVVKGTDAKPLEWSKGGNLEELSVTGDGLNYVAKMADGKCTMGLKDGTTVTVNDDTAYVTLQAALCEPDMPEDDDEEDEEEEEEEAAPPAKKSKK